ncbi:hypothetical protein [Protofrankia symbiont of Coriaria ruscifolia]|nr:hypothetical protein [Protofrankia symbiont of Coriaria ruscifolia]
MSCHYRTVGDGAVDAPFAAWWSRRFLAYWTSRFVPHLQWLDLQWLGLL